MSASLIALFLHHRPQVRIASIGITTNMRDLVQSKPDSYSPLSGADLIAQKVEVIVWMDGMYNFGEIRFALTPSPLVHSLFLCFYVSMRCTHPQPSTHTPYRPSPPLPPPLL